MARRRVFGPFPRAIGLPSPSALCGVHNFSGDAGLTACSVSRESPGRAAGWSRRTRFAPARLKVAKIGLGLGLGLGIY
jgi:hypothetical protein